MVSISTYDHPIGLNNGIIWGGNVGWFAKYNYVTNSYYFIDSEHPEVIEPWGGFCESNGSG